VSRILKTSIPSALDACLGPRVYQGGVDVAIYETHSGGEYDATNVIQKPIVTGITTIGMDHVEQLGPSIENIAWHKSGIFKPGSPAFSTLQESAAAEVLKDRAAKKGVTLDFVNVSPLLPTNARALKPEVQRTNSSLALALVSAFQRRGHLNRIAT
jgi:folylpolyglutamate synthase